MTPATDWQHRYTTAGIDGICDYPGCEKDSTEECLDTGVEGCAKHIGLLMGPRPRTVTAPRNAEEALSLLSAGVGALASVELTEDEKERVWRLIDKALDAVGETR